ncbi:hypothetical protein ACFVAQ_45560 [Streptomyces sp. NPDC057651]|uniref:hypothetical protein n=1 Tax=Streptomyces sp. NPDC057651 TaxID=3346194 RepID=UPI0036AE6723
MKLQITPRNLPPIAADRAPGQLVELDLDELALAFAQSPKSVARLLTLHAVNVLALDLAAVDDTAPRHECAMRAATAEGSRDALLAELGARPALAATNRTTNGITA